MSICDILILVVLLLATIRGFFKGFIQELFTLSALAIAGFIAAKFHGLLIPLLGQYISNSLITKGASYGLVFLAAVIILMVFAQILHNASQKTNFNNIDKILGSIFGLCEGILVVLLLSLAISNIFTNTSFYQKSMLVPKIFPYAQNIEPFLPKKLLEFIGTEQNNPSAS